MKTRREIRIESLQNMLKTVANYKRDFAKPVPKEELILWEAGENMELMPEITDISWWSERSIRAYVKGQYSIFQFDAILDEIEQPFVDNGYELDTKYSQFEKYGQEYELFFKPVELQEDYGRHDILKVVLKGSACTYVKTGKLVEEKRAVCNMVV